MWLVDIVIPIFVKWIPGIRKDGGHHILVAQWLRRLTILNANPMTPQSLPRLYPALPWRQKNCWTLYCRPINSGTFRFCWSYFYDCTPWLYSIHWHLLRVIMTIPNRRDRGPRPMQGRFFITVPFRLIRPRVWPVTQWTNFDIGPLEVWPVTNRISNHFDRKFVHERENDRQIFKVFFLNQLSHASKVNVTCDNDQN
jgi:hypothetical protein